MRRLGRSWPGSTGGASGSNGRCGCTRRRTDSSSGGQSDDRAAARPDPVRRGGPAAVGLPRRGHLARGPGQGGAAPVVLPQVLRGAGVRQGAAGVPGLPGGGGDPAGRQGPVRALRGRPLGGPMARDLMFQGEIKQAVRQAYAAITSGGGELVARRVYTDDELATLPSGAVDWALGVGDPVRYAMLRAGETALDVGSGGGIDTILAARRVGPGGKAVGLDTLEEMCERGRRHAAAAGVAGWTEFVGGDRPFGIDEASMYPLFTPEVIEVMRRTIPPDHHDHVATGVIVKARKPR